MAENDTTAAGRVETWGLGCSRLNHLLSETRKAWVQNHLFNRKCYFCDVLWYPASVRELTKETQQTKGSQPEIVLAKGVSISASRRWWEGWLSGFCLPAKRHVYWLRSSLLSTIKILEQGQEIGPRLGIRGALHL